MAMSQKTSRDFEFVVKSFKGMTHEICDKGTGGKIDNQETFKKFKYSLVPLIEEKKLACVLAQFPYGFFPNPENFGYLRMFKEEMENVPLVFEFRNRVWLKERTFQFLEKNGMGFCVVDEPKLSQLMPYQPRATTEIGYFRFHGRNMNWFNVPTSVRYDYLYNEKDLKEFIPDVKDISKKTAKTLIFLGLVGKGICFDTGGTNLKPARHMHGMHEDMGGRAVALGTLLALTELQVEFPVDCWLALAQNHIGPQAYKQNDVVTAANGTTIEIMHTDAEGRMVLADTLSFAARAKPRLILDFATLTGSCVGALSTRMSGALTNRIDYLPAVIEAGLRSGDRVWPFPLEKDYDKALKSDIADVKQCTLDSDADHILAASFLRRFIDGDLPSVHIDLSAGNHKGGLAHIPTDTTGFGVRFALNLLLDQNLAD